MINPIKGILRIHVIVTCILLLSSCSLIKSANKIQKEDSKKTELDSLAKMDSKTNTKITELADTTVKISGSQIEGSRPLSDLEKKPFVLEDGDQVVTISVDPESGNLRVKSEVKPRSVPIKVKKTTETKEEKKTTTVVKKDEEKKSELKQTDKEVKRFGLPWWVWLLFALVILAGLTWVVKGR